MDRHAIYLLQHKQFLHFPVMVNPKQMVTEHSALSCSQFHAGHPGRWHQGVQAAQYTMENPTQWQNPGTDIITFLQSFIKLFFIRPFAILDACTLFVEKLNNNLTEFGQQITVYTDTFKSLTLPAKPQHTHYVGGEEQHDWARNTSLFLPPQFPKKSALTTIIMLQTTKRLQHQLKSPIVEY